MKVSNDENQKLSDTIDQMQEALDVFIELYNQSEEDSFYVQLDEEVIELIKKAKHALGEDIVNQKVNTIMKEVLSFLPFDHVTNKADNSQKAEHPEEIH